jgi:hypothetical protein
MSIIIESSQIGTARGLVMAALQFYPDKGSSRFLRHTIDRLADGDLSSIKHVRVLFHCDMNAGTDDHEAAHRTRVAHQVLANRALFGWQKACDPKQVSNFQEILAEPMSIEIAEEVSNDISKRSCVGLTIQKEIGDLTARESMKYLLCINEMLSILALFEEAKKRGNEDLLLTMESAVAHIL